jgi:hypothetical protein
MSKLPSLTGKQVIDVLQRSGFVVMRSRAVTITCATRTDERLSYQSMQARR